MTTMADKNLTIWEQLRVIDRKATKPFTRTGGFRGTQIDPVWRMQRMTEAFGPCGDGWGWEQIDRHVSDGLVFVCVRAWYRNAAGEQCWTGPQWGGDTLTLTRAGKTMPNDEAFKMAMTDALGKALLSIGLAADVYTGQFDDSKYRDLSDREQDSAAEASTITAINEGIAACETLADLAAYWKEHWTHIKGLSAAAIHELTAAKDARKAALSPQLAAE